MCCWWPVLAWHKDDGQQLDLRSVCQWSDWTTVGCRRRQTHQHRQCDCCKPSPSHVVTSTILHHTVALYSNSSTILIQNYKKASSYSITERRVTELIPVLGSQPAGNVSHKPSGRLPLLSVRPAVTPQPLRGLLPVSLVGEHRHDGCEQFAYGCYPTASRLRFEPRPFGAWVQHANHSATTATTQHILQHYLVQCAVFFAHSVYVQLRTLEMQLCRILTDLIVLLRVHDEWPTRPKSIPAVHVQISGVSFIISKVSRQLVHRSSCDSVSRTTAFTHVHTVQLNSSDNLLFTNMWKQTSDINKRKNRKRLTFVTEKKLCQTRHTVASFCNWVEMPIQISQL